MTIRFPIPILSLVVTGLFNATAFAEPIPVAISPDGSGGFKMTRGGEAYFVKGAGSGADGLRSLAEAGGNSVRTWGAEALEGVLDKAHDLGLSVSAGIWLGQVRQGFDWSDAEALARQREHVRQTVEKYKDHPAILIWGLGNEMEDHEGQNGAVWSEIDSLAAMVKKIDPNHPTMTVIAEMGGDKIKNIHRLCPHIDIVGINTYGGGVSVAKRYKELGGTKPFIVSEFGPNGIWEVSKDALGAYPEKTSTQKAEDYRRTYEGSIAGGGMCLGSYAFVWGNKQEVTGTWFSMLLPDGSRLAPADTMTELWTGKPPANRCPEIRQLKIEGKREGKPGEKFLAELEVVDPEGDAVEVTWVLQQDPGQFGTGGDAEAVPPTYPDATAKASSKSVEITLPEDGGLYRLFAYVRDNKGGAAVGNISLRVDAPIKLPSAAAATLPYTVYAEADASGTYIPSGWMGDSRSLKLDPEHSDNPKEGKVSLRCAFNASEGWTGVAWQSPAGDWGDRPGGLDLSGARKLTFWARGEEGGETVSFAYGIIEKPSKFHDTAKGNLEGVVLGKEWKQYEIPVEGKNLTRIKTGFSWSTASSGKPVIFYLDSIRWE